MPDQIVDLIPRSRRRRGRSPRKTLRVLAEMNTAALDEARAQFRNERRQLRADRKADVA